MNEIERMAANAAIKKMLNKSYFDICVIDGILKITKGVPKREDYNLLHLLHCVHFADMEPELLRGLPVIINRVLDSEPFALEYQPEIVEKLTNVHRLGVNK